jgi:hypothetical protein
MLLHLSSSSFLFFEYSTYSYSVIFIHSFTTFLILNHLILTLAFLHPQPTNTNEVTQFTDDDEDEAPVTALPALGKKVLPPLQVKRPAELSGENKVHLLNEILQTASPAASREPAQFHAQPPLTPTHAMPGNRELM